MRKLFLLLLFIPIVSFGQQSFEEKFKDYMASQYVSNNKIQEYDDLEQLEMPFANIVGYDLNYIPCLVNGVYDYYVLDTGCSFGIAINNKLFKKILNTEEVFYEDFLGGAKMMTAVGDYSVVRIIIMNEVIIGKPSKSIRLKNVMTAVYDSDEGPLLLGQDILKRFSSITIDNKNQVYKFKK